MHVGARNLELLFSFVLSGSCVLECLGQHHALAAGDAFNIPPNTAWGLSECTEPFSLLQVVMPAIVN